MLVVGSAPNLSVQERGRKRKTSIARAAGALGRFRPGTQTGLRTAVPTPGVGTFVMAAVILVLGTYLLYPILILLVLSFDTARDILVGPATWGLDNWLNAWRQPKAAAWSIGTRRIRSTASA
jgi:ABC-type glycerol-3-phosphate transport system permease component